MMDTARWIGGLIDKTPASALTRAGLFP
jgi:hypothetical protein